MFCFTKYMGIDMSEGYIRAVDGDGSVLVEETIQDFIRENNIRLDTSQSVWADMGKVAEIVGRCKARAPKSFLGMSNVLLVIPAEFQESQKMSLIENVMNTTKVNKIFLIGNIIVAALGACCGETKIIGTDVTAKTLYVLCLQGKTYISLIWAGDVVDYNVIDKGCKNVDVSDLAAGIINLLNAVPAEVPERYLANPAMKPIINEWYKEFAGPVYISVPSDEQSRLGLMVDRFSVVYTIHSDRLFLDGLKKGVEAIRSIRSWV